MSGGWWWLSLQGAGLSREGSGFQAGLMLMGVMSLTSRCAPTVLDQSDEVKLRIRLPRLNPALEALILSMEKGENN